MVIDSKTPARSKRARPRLINEEMPDRRRDIMHAAERLFSRHGYHGVSIRNIADEAGVPLALVGYYYGPKLSLYEEVFRQRAGYIQERLAALDTVWTGASSGEVLERLVRAFVTPALKVASTPDGYQFMRLVARNLTEQGEENARPVEELFDPVARAYIDAFMKAIPGLARKQAVWCYQFALGALMHHITDDRAERLSQGEVSAGNTQFDESCDFLCRFLWAGIHHACQAR